MDIREDLLFPGVWQIRLDQEEAATLRMLIVSKREALTGHVSQESLKWLDRFRDELPEGPK